MDCSVLSPSALMRDGPTEGEGNGNDSKAERHAPVRITKHKSLHLSRNQCYICLVLILLRLQALLVCPEPWLPVSIPKITFFSAHVLHVFFFLHLFQLIWQVRLCKQINRSHTNYMRVICSRSACLTLCQQLVILEFVFKSISIALFLFFIFLSSYKSPPEPQPQWKEIKSIRLSTSVGKMWRLKANGM